MDILIGILLSIGLFAIFLAILFNGFLSGVEATLVKQQFKNGKRMILINKILEIVIVLVFLICFILRVSNHEYKDWNIQLVSPLGILSSIEVLLIGFHLWHIMIIRNRIFKSLVQQINHTKTQ